MAITTVQGEIGQRLSLYGLSGLEAVAMLVIGIFALLTSVAADFVVRRGRTRIDGAATGASAHHGRAEGRHTTPVVEEMIIPVATARRDAFA